MVERFYRFGFADSAREKDEWDTHEDNLRPLAQWLFRGVMNPDEVKLKMYSTKVMEYREEMKEVLGESYTSGSSSGTQRGSASGAGSGGTEVFGEDDANDPRSTSHSGSEFASESESESESYSESTTTSRSLVPTIVPVLGKELSHVQFRSLEEQLFRSMAILFDQEQQQGVVRLVGMKAPAAIRPTTIKDIPGSPEWIQRFLEKCYKKLPFALKSEEARQQLVTRVENLTANLAKPSAGEPTTSKRPVSGVPKKSAGK